MQLVLTCLPTAVFAYVGTPFRIVEEQIGRAAEVLLTMRVVALAPVVNGRVVYWAERCFVAVKHELVGTQKAFKIVQIQSEAFFTHQRTY